MNDDKKEFEDNSDPIIKMTDWENEPSLQDLKDDFNIMKSHHDDFILKVNKWRNIKKVSGEYKPKKINGKSSFQPKVAKKALEWRYPELSDPFLNNENIVEFRPTTEGDRKSARDNTILINYQFSNQINKLEYIDMFVRKCVDDGISITKVEWERETAKTVEIEDTYEYTLINADDVETLQILEQAITLRSVNHDQFRTLPKEIQESVNYSLEAKELYKATFIGSEEIIKERLIKNQPKLLIIEPENFYIDPTCGANTENARIMAITYETSLAELYAKGDIFKNLNQITLTDVIGNTNHKNTAPNDFINFKDKLRKRILVYEMYSLYDINGDGRLESIVSSWVGNTLIRLEENPYPDNKFPFVITKYRHTGQNVYYGESDCELLEDSQKQIGALSRGIIDSFGKSANGQTGFAKDFLDSNNKRKFLSGQDYEFNPSMPVNNGIYTHKFNEISSSAWAYLNAQQQEAQALTGIKTFDQGIEGNQYGNVVAGIRRTTQSTDRRTQDILRRLKYGFTEVVKKIMTLNHTFLEDEKIIRITNTEFLRLKKEDLIGYFDVKLHVHSQEENDLSVEKLLFLVQTIGPSMDLEMKNIVLSEIARLQNMPDLASKLEKFKPTPVEPTEIEKLEAEKLRMEIEEIKSKIKLNEARSLGEEADSQHKLIDLEDNISGKKDKREQDRIKSQARGNIELETAKALLENKEGINNIDAVIGLNEFNKQLENL